MTNRHHNEKCLVAAPVVGVEAKGLFSSFAGGNRILYRGIRAKVLLPVIVTDRSRPLAHVPSVCDADNPAPVVAGKLHVAAVDRARNVPKVRPSVVGSHSVDVVNFAAGVAAGHHLPDKPMGEKTSLPDADDLIPTDGNVVNQFSGVSVVPSLAAHVSAVARCGREHFRRSRLPVHLAGFWVVVEKLVQLIGIGYGLHSHRGLHHRSIWSASSGVGAPLLALQSTPKI
jgi:hypothetical protein